MKIVLGAFNAKVGRENIFKPKIGTENVHPESNDNGIRLFLEAHLLPGLPRA